MVHRLLRGLTFANVCSFLALTIALGTGTAYAANTVFSADIVNGEVKNADLAADSVTSSKVLIDTLTSGDLATNSVGALEITNNSVGANELAPNAVVGPKLAPNAVDSSKVGANALTGADINESTLAGVNAGTVGGMSVKKINWQVPTGTGQTPVLTFPGKLTIIAECQEFGDLVDVKAISGEDDSFITATVRAPYGADDTDNNRHVGSSGYEPFHAGQSFPIDDLLYKGFGSGRMAQIDFLTPSGFVAHIDLFMRMRDQTSQCRVTGTAIGG